VRIEEAMVRESRKINSIFKIKSECDAHETGKVPEPPEEPLFSLLYCCSNLERKLMRNKGIGVTEKKYFS
jgi:hypothetical protein